jgi:CYTH domain-containing protein
MKMEIERKFLVTGDRWRTVAEDGLPCEQGYICSGPDQVTVRVRRMGNKGFLTLKGASQGISRPEMEYEIPLADAVYMLRHFCADRLVSKTRYRREVGGLIWEIDEFSGRNEGLVLAEIELEHADQTFSAPDWLGAEVSHDRRYFNAALASNPYREWAF